MGVTEATVTEATSVRSQVESRVATLAKEAEETMSHAIGEMSQRLEHELETVASSTIMASAQNTRTEIEMLLVELQAKFNKDRTELHQEQLKRQGQMAGISESIEKLAQQLNAFKPMNERDLGNLKG